MSRFRVVFDEYGLAVHDDEKDMVAPIDKEGIPAEAEYIGKLVIGLVNKLIDNGDKPCGRCDDEA